ncbi:MAG: tRNA(Ile)(2)-agmatinylcytidine synthase [Thaumarchaeota archaeon]|nr:tRNA(Ile)(2)-agmatinylcytidine synthase [Nitrososphaerota archaeon]
MRCLIAFDDTDSRMGQCTTHLGYRVVCSLLSQGCVFMRYPRLVRLNPNIPFKTRGNAAVCLDFESDRPEDAFEAAGSLLRELSDVENGANSGAVFLAGDLHPNIFRPIYEAAVSGVVNWRKVEKILGEESVRHAALGNGMGLVGAAASLGFIESDDHTYELIAYRRPENCGKPRTVDPESVKRVEHELFPHTLSNYDYGSRRLLIAPHGPDPVFLGIRADSPAFALEAFRSVRYGEDLAGHMIYLSNQCTDAHLASPLSLPLSAYSSGWLEGSVRALEEGEGKHLYITLEVAGAAVPAAVYEPAGDLLRMARRLMRGDRVRAFGGVRRGTIKHPAILNVEKIEVLYAEPMLRSENPVCEGCGGSTKSEGRARGFQCRSCGARLRESRKRVTIVPRGVEPGVYLPSPGAQRHLTKQLIRYGREVHSPHALVDAWISPYEIRPLRAPVRSRR